MATLSSKSFVICCLGLYHYLLLDILVSFALFPFYDLDGFFFSWIYSIRCVFVAGWLAVEGGKSFKLGHYAQTFQHFFIPALVTGITDFNHLIPPLTSNISYNFQ